MLEFASATGTEPNRPADYRPRRAGPVPWPGGPVRTSPTACSSTVTTEIAICTGSYCATLSQDSLRSPLEQRQDIGVQDVEAHSFGSSIGVILDLLPVLRHGPHPVVDQWIVLEHPRELQPGIGLRADFEPYQLRPLFEPLLDLGASLASASSRLAPRALTANGSVPRARKPLPLTRSTSTGICMGPPGSHGLEQSGKLLCYSRPALGRVATRPSRLECAARGRSRWKASDGKGYCHGAGTFSLPVTNRRNGSGTQ